MNRATGLVSLLIFISVSAPAGWLVGRRVEGRSVSGGTVSTAALERPRAPESVPALATHIDGCRSYIEPPNGVDVEPKILPGAPIENLRHLYGQESKHDKTINEWEWRTKDFSLHRWGLSDQDKARSIGIDVNPGRIVATPDGVELGKDTFAAIVPKMNDRGVAVTEHMEGADGTWILFVSFPSTCDSQYWSEYTWYLDGTPSVEKAIGNVVPFRSDVFLQEVVKHYDVEASNEPEGEVEGQPSVHN